MIRLENLGKYYNRHKKNENRVLRDLSLTLPEKGLVAIFGRSGCGKTTLLSVIGGMDTQSEGRVTYLGCDTRLDYDRYRNEAVGYIFQSYLLQSGETVFDNVAAALHLIGITDREIVERRVLAALAAVGMDRYRNRLPGTLSGGQQQRVAIARAIVKNPPILLADEPTGNLDEANTTQIMELLRAISREHLVLLVTHEEKLVSRYADRIITLSDGEIESDLENVDVLTEHSADQHKIYLGDLPKKSQSVAGVTLHRYGEGGAEISLTVVTRGTETYLRIDSGHVHLLDESSEMQLIDGKHRHNSCEKSEVAAMNMAELPPIAGKRFGRLYGWKTAIFGAFRAMFGRHRRRDRALRLALTFFSVVAVFLTSVMGCSIGEYLEQEGSYSKHTVYVYTPDRATSAHLSDGAAGSLGIELVRMRRGGYLYGDEYYYFRPHAFETYRDTAYYSGLSTNAVLLPLRLAESCRLLAGEKTGLKENEILITSAAADQILSESTAGYLSAYGDLIGLSMTNSYLGNGSRIVGVVESSERAIYFSEMALARMSWDESYQRVAPASDYGISVADGETVFVGMAAAAPAVGSNLVLRGETLSLIGLTSPALELASDVYLVSDADYVRLSVILGDSSACFYEIYDREGESASSTKLIPLSGIWYSVLHIESESAAREYLVSRLGEHTEPDEYHSSIIYPSEIRERLDEDAGVAIVIGVVSLVAALALLSLSVALMMRSTLFSRVKEIGILRAIGVSRRNLFFRFSVESGVLAVSTVFVGFLLASAFIGLCFGVSGLTASVFFYPPWLALSLLVLLLGVSIVFGILPFCRLLRSTPSKILSKYDV